MTNEGEAMILKNLLESIQPWWETLISVSWILGLAFCVLGVVAVTNTQSNSRRGLQRKAIVGGLVTFLTGIALFNIQHMLNALSMTLFNQTSLSSLSTLSYVPPNPDSPTGLYLQLAVWLIMLVGLYGVIRGFLLLRDSAKNGGVTFWSGLTHVIGGAIAVNIVPFGTSVAATMGSTISDLFRSVVGGT